MWKDSERHSGPCKYYHANVGALWLKPHDGGGCVGEVEEPLNLWSVSFFIIRQRNGFISTKSNQIKSKQRKLAFLPFPLRKKKKIEAMTHLAWDFRFGRSVECEPAPAFTFQASFSSTWRYPISKQCINYIITLFIKVKLKVGETEGIESGLWLMKSWCKCNYHKARNIIW